MSTQKKIEVKVYVDGVLVAETSNHVGPRYVDSVVAAVLVQVDDPNEELPEDEEPCTAHVTVLKPHALVATQAKYGVRASHAEGGSTVVLEGQRNLVIRMLMAELGIAEEVAADLTLPI